MLCRVLTSRVFATSLLMAMLAILAIASPARAIDGGLEEALAEAQQTGKPLLVLGTATWCGPCQRLKRQLSSDERFTPLLQEYISVALDIESPEFQQWKALHQPHSNTIPMLFIVTSQGEELYNASGVPPATELTRILNLGIAHRQQAEQLAQLPAASETPVTSEAPAAAGEETAEGENIDDLPQEVREARAESYLRMAQLMAQDQPERSRECAQQAMQLAPQSREAELARKLLETLPLRY